MNAQSETKARYLAAVDALAAQLKRNEYGDFVAYPPIPGARFVTGAGKHTRLPASLRATQLDGWSKYGPRKSIGYLVNDEVLALYDATVAEAAAEKKAAKKLADQAAAKAAGYATVAAWRRAEKDRIAREEQAAAEAAAKARAEREQRTKERLAALGLDADWSELSESVIGVLEAAKMADFDFSADHIYAVCYAERNESSAWLAYCAGEMSASSLLHRCERAQHRHENTDYDDLLRAGYDRDLARELCSEY